MPVVAPYNTVLGWHGDAKVAYLTFDDGPGPDTGRVLDTLASAGVKATFCLIGMRVSEAPAVAQRVVADGHTLCNHSWDHHSPFDGLPPADLDTQIARTQPPDLSVPVRRVGRVVAESQADRFRRGIGPGGIDRGA